MTFEEWCPHVETLSPMWRFLRQAWDAATKVERERCAVVAEHAAEHAAGHPWGGPPAACLGVAGRIRVDPDTGE